MTEESTARRREMGWTARALRSGTHLSAQALAHRVGVLPSKVSRWENGLREMTAHDMALYMGACGVDEAERKRLLELSKPPSDLYWVRPHFTRNTDALKSVIVQESLANRLVGYEPLVVPELYQTEAYARAVLEWRGPDAAAWIDLRMKALRDRQQVLRTPSAPQGTFYLHERALRTVVGDSRVMHEQLLLLVLSSSLPYCSLRVVPDSAGPYGTIGGPFTILEFADHPATVSAETFGGTLFIDDRSGVDAYYGLVEKLEQDALGRGRSREWLVRLADEYEQGKE